VRGKWGRLVPRRAAQTTNNKKGWERMKKEEKRIKETTCCSHTESNEAFKENSHRASDVQVSICVVPLSGTQRRVSEKQRIGGKNAEERLPKQKKTGTVPKQLIEQTD
jgi:hypothetical protein